MTKFLTYVLAATASAGLLSAPHVCAAAQNSKEITEFGLLDLILEIDPDVKGFSQDVAIELRDADTGRKYQYVFRHSQNYIIPDNPIKVIANATYNVETYIRDSTGVYVAGADGQAVTQIHITPDGAALVLIVKSAAASAAQNPGQAGAAQDPVRAGKAQDPAQGGVQGDLSSLIPVMDRFYEKTSYDKTAGVAEVSLRIWTKWTTNEERFLRDPNHTAEQWENFSLYEKANYMALTIIPFEVLFLYPSVHIDKNDKSSFTKTVYSSIEILKAASMDGGVYYDEICRVLDWEWEYYVQTSDYVNVIDEYARLKAEAGGQSNNHTANGNPNVNGDDNGNGNEDVNAGGSIHGNSDVNADVSAKRKSNDNAGGNANDKPNVNVNDNVNINVNANDKGGNTVTPAKAANNTPAQNSQDDVAKTVQKGLIDKILGNIIPIAVGLALLLVFILIKKWNERRIFQSDEKEDGEN